MPLLIPVQRIPAWTNWRRRRFLRRFRDGLDAYFAAVRYEAFPFRVIETEEAAARRRELEQGLGRCRRVVSAAGVSSLRLVPGDTEGDVTRVDVVTEAFDLHRYGIRREDLLDVLDRAHGVYRRDRSSAWLRTLNPLYWIDMGLGFAEVLPFVPLIVLRRDWRPLARSPAGRMLRLLLRAGVLAGLAVGVAWAVGFDQVTMAATRLHAVAARFAAKVLR